MSLPPLLNGFRAASAASALLIAALLLAPGCEPTVDVFRPSEQYRFSLYGALNVAADTQAIRVSPIDDTTEIGAPPNLNVTVLLENVDTGEQVTLRDSFTMLNGDAARVHNYWTTHPIQPATSYQVTVRSEDEAVTTATTTTPARAPELSQDNAFLLPCVFPRPFGDDKRRDENTFVVTVQNVDRIAAANVTYFISHPPSFGGLETVRTFSYYSAVEDKGPYFEIPVFYRPALVDLNPNPSPFPQCASIAELTYSYARAVVASGGPNWPKDWRGLPLDEVANRDAYSNVTGGHGFVGGVYTDTIRVPVHERPP